MELVFSIFLPLKRLLLFVLFLFLLRAASYHKEDGFTDIKKSLVNLKISAIYYDPLKPWLKNPLTTSHSIGLVVSDNQILTSANKLRNASLIEVSSHASYEKSLAKVVFIDYGVNLALLSVKRKGFFSELIPLELGGIQKRGDIVTGAYIDSYFQAYNESFRIQDVSVASYLGFTDIPLYTFHSIDSYPHGGVLLKQKKVCGLISYSNDEGDSEAIPAVLMRRFLIQAKNKTSKSSAFVAQGFRLKSLVDPVLRNYYGVHKDLKGVIVDQILPNTSAWGTLQEGDILISIDGVPIDSLGLYEHPLWGRQDAQLLLMMDGIGLRFIGQKVKVSAFRKGKLKEFTIRLRGYNGGGERIPEDLHGPSAYFIKNGIVFLELSIPLLERLYGSKWRRKTSLYSYLVKYKQYYQKSGNDRIVVIGNIFPDTATKGIEEWSGKMVTRLNGKNILNLKSLFKDLDELSRRDVSTAQLLLHDRRPLYLDLKNNKAINQRIASKYNIPKMTFFPDESR